MKFVPLLVFIFFTFPCGIVHSDGPVSDSPTMVTPVVQLDTSTTTAKAENLPPDYMFEEANVIWAVQITVKTILLVSAMLFVFLRWKAGRAE